MIRAWTGWKHRGGRGARDDADVMRLTVRIGVVAAGYVAAFLLAYTAVLMRAARTSGAAAQASSGMHAIGDLALFVAVFSAAALVPTILAIVFLKSAIPPAMRDGIRYWELWRLPYNAVLMMLVLGWIVGTWPHFRPAFTLMGGIRLVILAVLANLCYCAAYVVDFPLALSPIAPFWRRRRWVLWLAGTLFAVVFACYWIADEIYPYVDGR